MFEEEKSVSLWNSLKFEGSPSTNFENVRCSPNALIWIDYLESSTTRTHKKDDC